MIDGGVYELDGWRTFVLAGGLIESKAELLATCAGAMEFPAWFGHNWDALADCLADLSWLPAAAGYVALWQDASCLADADPDAFQTALDVFRGASEAWRFRGIPFVVLVCR